MSYYMRLLTPHAGIAAVDALRAGLADMGRPDVTLIVDEDEDDTAWTALVAYTDAGEPIGLLTRDVVDDPEGLAKDEIEDFSLELQEALPKSGAAWVRAYLKQVKTIYAIQFMAKAFEEAGEGVPGMMIETLRETLGGIIQADGEGFSNEAGAQVVWQHDDAVEGDWTAAVIGPDKAWVSFRMDRASPAHRAAFLGGSVPADAEILPPDADE